VRRELPERLATQGLQRQLEGEDPGETDPAAWLRARLGELGLAGAEDLRLVEAEDLLPPLLPPHTRKELDARYPRSLRLPAGPFQVEYQVAARRVVLVAPPGVKRAPARRDLPSWPGWAIYCRIKNRETKV